MEKKTRILQVGIHNWENTLRPTHAKQLSWTFLDVMATTQEDCEAFILKMKKRTFDVVLVTDQLDSRLLESLSDLIESYGLILDSSFEREVSPQLVQTKCPNFMALEKKEEVLEALCQSFFSGQMGTKLHVQTIDVSDHFKGAVSILGEHRLVLAGDFRGLNLSVPLLTWQYNIVTYGRNKKLWLEYDLKGSLTLDLTVQGIQEGSSHVFRTWKFNQDDIKNGMEIPYEEGLAYLSLSLSIEGQGELEIGPLHYRDSRGSYGEYLLGGQKIADSQNEELYYYFHPGDLKPPLNVYFSGYRSAEGFEGFYMMKSLGAPFLLITDPRLEGGSFYLGSSELESSLKEVIQHHLMKLGFSSRELILSGLSMGTFGALYYGSFLEPHSIIVGKPLVSLGSMAEKERIVRPGGFPTSLDLLQSLTGRQDQEGIQTLDQYFWTAFDEASFDQTQFVMAYMQDDDYDDTAYGEIIEHLAHKEARVIGKGIPGRHNDNSEAINEWFYNHYRRILEEYFQRGGAYALRN